MSNTEAMLWHKDYGLPTTYEEAKEMYRAFWYQKDKTEADYQYQDDYRNFATDITDFAKQAKDVYGEEEFTYLEDYANEKRYYKLQVIDLPRESFEETVAVLGLSAQAHNMVMLLWGDAEGLSLPDGTGLTAQDKKVTWGYKTSYKKWQKALKQSKEKVTKLPTTSARVQKYINQEVEKHLKAKGIKTKQFIKFEKGIDYGRHQLSLWTGGGIDKYKKSLENKNWVKFTSYIYIYINDLSLLNNILKKRGSRSVLSNFSLGLQHFHNLPNDPKPADEYHLKTLPQLNKAIKQSAEMLIYIYPHCQDIHSIYDYLSKSYDDPHLGAHTYRRETEVMARPKTMIALARLTKQPNFDELVGFYRQKEIDIYISETNNCIRQSNEMRQYIYERRDEGYFIPDDYLDENGNLKMYPDIAPDSDWSAHIVEATEEYDKLIPYLKQLTDQEIDDILAIKDPWKPEIFR